MAKKTPSPSTAPPAELPLGDTPATDNGLPANLQNLRVLRLEATNVKRLRAVGINFDPNVNLIAGQNEQGKSSVLDAISWGIAGKALMQKVPIRKGEESATIKVDLGELIIERRFTASGQTIVVKPKNGEKIKSPQTLLDKLFGTNTFDAMSFGALKGKPRLEAVMRVAGVDVTDLDKSYDQVFEERKTANAELARLEAELAGAPNHPEAPLTETPVTDFADRLAGINARNKTREDIEKLLTDTTDDIERTTETIADLESKLKIARGELTRFQALESTLQEKKIEAGKPEDPQTIITDIATAEASNKQVRENQAYLVLKQNVSNRRSNTTELTEELKRLQSEKKRRLGAAKFPIEGLSFGEDDILFNELPVEQASQSQQIRLFFAMSVAMNKPLRIGIIREGSLLDSEKLELVEKLATEFDVQVFIELVGEGDEAAVIIEDGMVKRKAKEPKP